MHDKSALYLPRQDKRVDCILPQRGAVSGQITAYKKARYYGIATNEVLEPKYRKIVCNHFVSGY